LPIIELTDAGEPSTSEATLKQLREKHPVVDLILQHRGVKIQISHFIDGWINRMVDGRLHPNFKMHGTVTGRTSCTDPNLQQVPRDPKIRSLLGAPPGRTFVECDHSQAELRIATILSGDPTMTRIYQTGGDIHTHTYEMVSGEKISDDKHIKKEQRKKAKAVNFGFVYGMGWRKFKDYARDTYGIILTDKEAKEYREKFFRTYNKLPEWHQRQRKIVNALGQVRNPIGRLRRLPDIYSSDQGKKAEAERQAINSPVQGFGSDLTIMGMIEVTGYAKVYHKHLVLDKSRFDCIGTVHDATLFEVDDDYLMEFIPRVKEIMQNPKVLSDVFHFESPIPIVVDFSVGKQWSQGVELHFENDEWKNQIKEYLQSQIA
jgi:DNA polymerase-1